MLSQECWFEQETMLKKFKGKTWKTFEIEFLRFNKNWGLTGLYRIARI